MQEVLDGKDVIIVQTAISIPLSHTLYLCVIASVTNNRNYAMVNLYLSIYLIGLIMLSASEYFVYTIVASTVVGRAGMKRRLVVH